MFLGQKRKRKEKNEKEIGKEEKKMKEKTWVMLTICYLLLFIWKSYRPLAVLFEHENEGRLFKLIWAKN